MINLQINSKLKNKLAAVFTLFAYLIICRFAYSNVVKAQDILPLTVVPPKQEVLVNPGEKFVTTVKYLNQGSVPVSGTISVLDFIVEDNVGTPLFLDNPTVVGTTTISAKYSAAKWISFPTENVTIAENGNVAVPVTINVPKNAAAGGRYAAILFQPTINQVEDGKEGTAITPTAIRLASLIYIRVAGPIAEKARIVDFRAPEFLEYGPIEISTTILNEGNYHITPKGEITLKDMFGRVVSNSSLDIKNIFPGSTRVYNTNLGSKLMFGKFTATLNTTYGEKGQLLTSTLVIWLFPWRVALAIALAVVIIVLIIKMWFKRVTKKEQKLEEELKEETSELEALKSKFKDQISSSENPKDQSPPSTQ
ncbi:MAG: hypothetical protein HYV90_05660 [Candidatus Woesebacteria bacterium]|nr:MAG: hypothetical protein HYV90_05660 [Candidatus Woesebacteria bacterium]